MNEVKDILKDLDVDIDLNDINKDIKLVKLEKNTSNEIIGNKKKKDIILKQVKKNKLIFKNKTKTFDSLINKKRLKQIDLSNKKKEKINLAFL